MNMPEGYTKVSPVFLQAEEPLQVNIYIYMPLNKKVILFQKKGDILPTERLFELMKLPPSHILTSTTDAKTALDDAATEIAEKMVESEKIPEQISEDATQIVQSIANVESDDPQVRLEQTRSQLDGAAELVNRIVTLLKESGTRRGFQELVATMKHDGNSLETHHQHCSALSILLLLSFGETNTEIVSELAYASMCHDLGLKELPEDELLRHVQGDEIKAIIDPTPGVKANSNFHTARTKHIDATLQALRNSGKEITEGVFKIISQHHENMDGSGPIGISGRKIYGPAKILRLTDDLVSLLGGNTGVNDLETAFRVLNQANMKNGRPQYYDDELMAQLDKVLHGR